jgi:RNA polymerase sigma-70 factor, ECF subfamily
MHVDPSDEPVPMSIVEVAALAELFQEHRARLLEMLQRRLDPKLGVRTDAEGLIAETFILARRKWQRFATSGMSAYTWLYGIARDCLIEAWRRENRAGRKMGKEVPWPDASSQQMAMGLMGSLTSPSEVMARGEMQERVQQALDVLRATDREIIWMHHFDELPFRDVALVLGISEDTARQRYGRALRRLKDLWLELFDRGGSGP